MARRRGKNRPDFLSGIPRRDGLWFRVGRWWYHPIHGRVPVIAGGTTAAFTQTHARFRNDDGSETTATFKANEDANTLMFTDTNYRIRIQVDETAGGTSANFVGVLRYSHNGGAYTAVSGSSSVVRASASPNVADEAATTAQLTAPTGTFLTGAFDEADGSAGTTQVDFAAGQYTEFEWCFQVRSADVSPGDTIDFRCYRGTNALNTYSVTIRATVANVRAMGAGSIALTGLAHTHGRGLAATLGAVALTGLSVGVGFKAPETGTLDIVGLAPTISTTSDTVSQPGAGSISIAGQAPEPGHGIAIPVGSIALTGQTPERATGTPLPAGSIALTGLAPATNFGLAVPIGSLSITGQAPSPGIGVGVPIGAISVSGLASTSSYGVALPLGAITISGATPSLTGSGEIAVPPGSIAVTGLAPRLLYVSPVPVGSVSITGLAPTVSANTITIIATYSGAASGIHNFLNGALNLTTTGTYTITFNRTALIRARGVAGGGGGGNGNLGGNNSVGGGGGGGGASNTVGEYITVSPATNYTAVVGTSGSDDGGVSSFGQQSQTAVLELNGGIGGANASGSTPGAGGAGGSVAQGANGVAGAAGAAGGARNTAGSSASSGSGARGGGGGGGGGSEGSTAGQAGGLGGSSSDQSGGAGGAGKLGTPFNPGTDASGRGGNAVIGDSNDAAGGGGGGGGGVSLAGDFYGGGGGGGAGVDTSSSATPGTGGDGDQGVIVLDSGVARAPDAGSIVITGRAPGVNIASGSGPSVPVGSLSITGQSMGIAFKAPSTGSLDITGRTPSANRGLSPLMPVGSISVSGNFVAVRFLGPSAGTITLTGLAPQALAGLVVPAGSLVITGRVPSLVFNPAPSPAPTGTTLTGQNIRLNFGLGMGQGQLTITGLAPTVSRSFLFQMPAGTLNLTGRAPSLISPAHPDAGTIAITGRAPSAGFGISISVGSIAITGLTPTADKGTSPGAAAITITGAAPVLGYGIAIPAGSLDVPGQGPNSLLGAIGMPVGTITITGLAPTFSLGLTVPPGQLSITGQTPTATVQQAGLSEPGAGSISITGQSIALLFAVSVPVGSIDITGLSPASTGELNIAVPAGSITITGLAPDVPSVALMPVGSLTLDPTTPALLFSVSIGAGSISITGLAPSAGESGFPFPSTGAITLTGLAPAVGTGITLPAGLLTIEGQASQSTAFLAVPAGTLTITGWAPLADRGSLLPVGSIAIIGRVPLILLGGDTPLNQSACTAADLRPFSVTQFQNVHANGITYTVWYKLTAQEEDKVISVFAWGDDPYRPNLSVWFGPDCSNLTGVYLELDGADRRAIQFPVTPGETYWIQVDFDTTPGGPSIPNPTPAILEITARSFVDETIVQRGSILIPDDTTGYQAAILDATTGLPIKFLHPFPAGESAYVLDSGHILVEDIDTFTAKLYSPQLELIADVPVYPATASEIGWISGRGNLFYVVNGSASPGTNLPARMVRTIDVNGNFGPITWGPIPGLTSTSAIAVSPDQSTLYYSGTSSGSGSKIGRWDLVNNVALPDLTPSAPAAGLLRRRQMLALKDGSVLAGYVGPTSSNFSVYRFDPSAGAVLNAYDFTSSLGVLQTSDINENQIALSLDDPNSFLVWVKVQFGVSRFAEIRCSDGAILSQTPLVPQFEVGLYQEGFPSPPETPISYWGHSESCPFLALRVTVSEEVIGEPPVFEGEPVPDFDSICITIERRLGDPNHRIWSGEEIDLYLLQGVKEMCTSTRLIWDWVYPENLPRGFSFTSPFELDEINLGLDSIIWKYGQGDGMGDGLGNYTFDYERRFWPTIPNVAESKRDEDIREGPVRHTFPDEIPFMIELGNNQVPATAELPHRLTEIERSVWDKRTMDATSHRFVAPEDSRYEVERGEVHSYTWRKDGPRTFRKIRVPSAVADTVEVQGLWGIARDVDEIAGTDIEGTWGAPRIMPGFHPIGPFYTYRMWGIPRRFYLAGKNVKVEHWRIPYLDCIESELPPRYRAYLVFYAMWRCLSRQGPGQDMKLAGWYKARWIAALERITRRVDRQTKERTGRMGGASGIPPVGKPPRPRLPWQYGKRIQ